MSRARGFNAVRVEGDVAYLALTNVRGETVAEARVDAGDLPLLRGLGRRWSPMQRQHTMYAYFSTRVRGKQTIFLHRVVMGEPPGLVDHLDGDGLNNCRSNLRVATDHQNQQNRRGASRNSSTGVRGVGRIKDCTRRPYRVTVGYPALFLMNVTTLNIARITASMARVQLWGKEAA